MGCFNTKGFFSGLDIGGGEKAFILICAQYHKPLNLERYVDYSFSFSGVMYPITFPIFGEYDDYGNLENIQKDFNTYHLENLIGDTIENFLKVLYEITLSPRGQDQETIDKYNSYKKAILGEQGKSEEKIKEAWTKYGLDKRYTLDEWIKLTREVEASNNLELTWTMDYAWVYDNLGSLYYPEVNDKYADWKNHIFGSLSTTWSKFDLVWGKDSDTNKVYEYEFEIRKYLSFAKYLYRNDFQITHSFGSGQVTDWEKIHNYLSEKIKFIERTFKDYLE